MSIATGQITTGDHVTAAEGNRRWLVVATSWVILAVLLGRPETAMADLELDYLSWCWQKNKTSAPQTVIDDLVASCRGIPVGAKKYAACDVISGTPFACYPPRPQPGPQQTRPGEMCLQKALSRDFSSHARVLSGWRIASKGTTEYDVTHLRRPRRCRLDRSAAKVGRGRGGTFVSERSKLVVTIGAQSKGKTDLSFLGFNVIGGNINGLCGAIDFAEVYTTTTVAACNTVPPE